MALTYAECRGAKLREKAHKLCDSGSPYLLVAASGTRTWRLKYRVNEQEKVCASANTNTRKKRLLHAGVDPSAPLVTETAELHLSKDMMKQWLEKNQAEWSEVNTGASMV